MRNALTLGILFAAFAPSVGATGVSKWDIDTCDAFKLRPTLTGFEVICPGQLKPDFTVNGCTNVRAKWIKEQYVDPSGKIAERSVVAINCGPGSTFTAGTLR